MNKNLLFLLLILTTIGMVNAQTLRWRYTGEIKFPSTDTAFVNPFLCTMDSTDRLYVVSSKVSSARAHNAIFYLNPGDTVFKKMIDFDNNGDSDTLNGNVGAIRGITAIAKDIYISNNIPFPRTRPNTVASLYYYKNADTTLVEKFGFGLTGAGYGTYLHGLASTKDTFLMAGISFNTSFRFYNFSNGVTTPSRGSWVSMATYPVEPGGPATAGADIIRDVATVPGGDYSLPETPFYSTRNSLSTTQVTGGIAAWTGGSQSAPVNYVGTRITDGANDLSFDKAIPNGITVDKNKILWVAGTDSTRRWVKGFRITVNFAQPLYELPSSTTMGNPDPLGAPMASPADVALSKDATTAYVVDIGNGKVYKFRYTTTDIEDNSSTVQDFGLLQNYPNPFNPSTIIVYSLPKAMNVKLTVYNSLGQPVRELANGFTTGGVHSVEFNGEGLSSGVYYYRLTSEVGSFSRKMMFVK